MKKLLMIILATCLSCQEKQSTNLCLETEKKYDSLLIIKKRNEEAPFIKFYDVLRKEKGKLQDSLLINEYNNLKGKDSLIDFYISERINTINYSVFKFDVLEEYKGKYLLGKTYNINYSEVTNILISNDSCFIFKGKNIVAEDRIKLINSSNQHIKGRFRIKNFNLSLAQFSKHKFIMLKNNSCADCEQLQFFKVN
jgi:hypothetical protein